MVPLPPAERRQRDGRLLVAEERPEEDQGDRDAEPASSRSVTVQRTCSRANYGITSVLDSLILCQLVCVSCVEGCIFNIVDDTNSSNGRMRSTTIPITIHQPSNQPYVVPPAA